jgi:murein DD-endopeptidase MepM/ murein hydrolase activator NlpD
MQRAIFIDLPRSHRPRSDRPRSAAVHSFDRKRELILNQRVVPKNRKKVAREKKVLSESVLIKSIFMKKGLCLIVGASLLSFFFLFPLFLDIKSYLWEKERVVFNEEDLVYNLFLMEGAGNTEEVQAGVRDGEFVIPSLRLMSYQVRKGDSLFGIARKFNVSVDAIITANNLENAYYLQIGSKLQIPSKSGVFYHVKKGDSLFGIAKRYGVSVNSIADINDLASSVIQTGDRLFIPGGALTAWERASAIGEIFKHPVKGRLTSRMGFRIDPFTKRRAYHTGIDIANKVGTPVISSQFGRVIFTGYRGHYGKTVIVVHPQGYETLYAHLDKITVKRGQTIKQGERIGTIGNTGRSTGPHLHFEVHQNGKLVDPLKVIRMR